MGWRIPWKRCPKNQLSRVFMDSWRIKGQALCLHVAEPGRSSVHMLWLSAWCFFLGHLTMGMGIPLTLLLLLELFSSGWVALSSYDVRTFGLCYQILFFWLWLLSLRCLLFSGGKGRGGDLRREGGEGQLGPVKGGATVDRMYCKGRIFSVFVCCFFFF